MIPFFPKSNSAGFGGTRQNVAVGVPERGIRSMIEIIREEETSGTTEKRGLPKDIKQIGRPDIGDRIYVENQVYQFLHPYNSIEEKKAYVLLGRFENYAGRQCVFVEAAIPLKEIDFDGELPLWNDQTWAYIYKQLKREYDSMVIVGWALDMKGQLPNMTVRLESLHQQNFGGAHQVLYLMDSLECEEAFYGSRSGHLYRREGFYIYYEKQPATHRERGGMEKSFVTEDITDEKQHESYVAECDEEKTSFLDQEEVENEDIFGQEPKLFYRGSYRKQMSQEQEAERPLFSSYATTVLLFAVVCVLGVTAYLNHEKMAAMEETLAQMNQTQMATTEQDTASDADTPAVVVETVNGNVQKQTDESATTPSSVEQSSADGGAAATSLPTSDAAAETEGATADAMATEANTETGVSSEAAAASATEANTEAGSNTETEANAEAGSGQQVATEAQTYLSQGYYVVQKGDSLVGICKKIYQTTAMLDKLCEVNGIEDQDSIYAGQYLTLPN